jgi:hemoglobin
MSADMNNPPASSAPAQASVYERIGGAEAVRRVAERFYDIMNSSSEAAGIRRMHAGDLTPMRQKLFEFMSGWLGGPNLYFARSDRKCMMSAHAPYDIGIDERDQWLGCMHRALHEEGIASPLREQIEAALFRFADALRTSRSN